MSSLPLYCWAQGEEQKQHSGVLGPQEPCRYEAVKHVAVVDSFRIALISSLLRIQVIRALPTNKPQMRNTNMSYLTSRYAGGEGVEVGDETCIVYTVGRTRPF